MISVVRKTLKLLPKLAVGEKLTGRCPCCDRSTLFLSAGGTHFREDLRCARCFCAERNRAVMSALEKNYPGWRNTTLHEASPYGRLSKKLKLGVEGYSSSTYLSDHKRQAADHQDLQCLSFANESFDLFITQDVLEHVSDPIKAIKEVHRVLKPGGAHIWTVPYYPASPTVKCAEIRNGQIVHLETPEYHGDPLDPDGALVFTRWGNDHQSMVDDSADFETEFIEIFDRKAGVIGKCSQVFISRKSV